MDRKKLNDLASQLLDTGKRNPLINLNPKSATLIEVLVPTSDMLFKKIEGTTKFEAYDPKILDDEEVLEEPDAEEEQDASEYQDEKSRYRAEHAKKLRRQNQLLLYHHKYGSTTALKNIDKRAKEFLDGTGVNVAYMTFGMVHWKESDSSQIMYHAPLLLVPIQLSQSSSIAAYQIVPSGDDIVVNPTFAHWLEQNYSIHLPECEEESLDSYLEQVSALLKKLTWMVTPDCWIGIFSFQKLNMYRDIMDHQDIILANPNVQRLLGMNSTTNYSGMDAGSTSPTKNPLIELHTVVDADSSQLEAVEMARSGKSFVLQGPPGTGKSQTITNIIAECLYNGKKVLFVSEKQAALNVVFEKLKGVGLSEFCLELHSHKANKKEIITEICHTLNLNKHNVSPQADVETAMKVRVQEQLDTYERELHLVREPLGKSLYDLYELYASLRKTPDLSWTVPDLVQKGEPYVVETVSLLKQYVEYLPTIGYDYRKNPWYGYRVQDVSHQTRTQVAGDLQTTVAVMKSLLPICDEMASTYNVTCSTLEQAQLWGTFFRMAETSSFLTPDLLQYKRLEQLQAVIQPLKNISTEVLKARKALEDFWEPTLYQMQGAELYKKLVTQYAGFLSRLFKKEYRELAKNLQLCRKSGKRPSYTEAVAVAKQLSVCQEAEQKFQEAVQPVEALLGPGYNGPSTDWELLVQQLQVIQAIMAAGLSFGSMEQFTAEALKQEQKRFGEIATRLQNCFKDIETSIERTVGYFYTSQFPIKTVHSRTALERLQACLESMEQLTHWCQFRSLLTQMEQQSLQPFLAEVIQNNIEPNEIVHVFQKCFYTQWIEYIFSSEDVFSSFNRIAQDQNVDIFAEKDREQFEISKAQIRARLSQDRPDTNLVTTGSPVYILRKEGQRKQRQMSIRKLMMETGEVVQKIKPCFLMSPLSVSTFLPPEAITFDTVIFDEASQIFPHDAIGAIYRGKQLIVVGDPKQMPPTNFFNTATKQSDENDDDASDVADYESILDYCMAASFPCLSLQWHYRSRYEQLIAFSNKNFYNNTLITFPSAAANQQGVGVDYHYVNGVYDRSSRTNRAEAEYVVDLIYQHIKNHPKRSLGVVAFSISQQTLIEKLLAKRRQNTPQMEFFFRNSSDGAFFIKNLETVQGDERDTIIFSVAYGKDTQGKLLYYFSPLNRTGGERRLNVAVTRAKENVQLVSSMHYTDIDLSRSGAEGVRLLREYLDYAENGTVALKRSVSVGSDDQFDSDFEMDVCEYLRSKGFTVDTQVGCSGYRIDLALKHPGTSNYVLAIECDGATYHSGKNARDRDRLRQEILERMGWKFYRIWSTDWFRNRKLEQERLLKAATEAFVGILREPVLPEKPQMEDAFKKFEETEVAPSTGFPVYQTAEIAQLKQQYGETMYQEDVFQKFILEILKIEAPLSETLLLSRIVDLFDNQKVTKKVRDTFAYRMIGCQKYGIVIRDGFLYLEGKTEYKLRLPNEESRPIKEIALEELAAGLLALIQENITVEKMGLYRSLTNLCGYDRVGKTIAERLDMALALLGNQI